MHTKNTFPPVRLFIFQPPTHSMISNVYNTNPIGTCGWPTSWNSDPVTVQPFRV